MQFPVTDSPVADSPVMDFPVMDFPVMDFLWGTNGEYPGRAHLVPRAEHFALCSTRLLRLPLAIAERWHYRPAELVICPECAIAYVAFRFPALTDPPPAFGRA